MTERYEFRWADPRGVFGTLDTGYLAGAPVHISILPLTQRAIDRARELLHDHLTREQSRSLDTAGYFEVVGSESGTTYRIKHRNTNVWHRNVVSVIDGKERFAFDASPMTIKGPTASPLPWGDVMLAQKLCLENDEAHFLKVACSSPIDVDAYGIWLDDMLNAQIIQQTQQNLQRQYREIDLQNRLRDDARWLTTLDEVWRLWRR